MSTHKAAPNLNELKIAILTDRPWPAQTCCECARGWAGRSALAIGARHSHAMQGTKGRPREADNSIWLASTVPAFVAKTSQKYLKFSASSHQN